MRVSAWNNGTHLKSGAGYGLRMSRAIRDRWFRPEWPNVVLELDGGTRVAISLTPSFWRSCSELRSAELGRWLLRLGLAPWPSGAPPFLELEHMEGSRFRLSLPSSTI
jgi:hypothetical protein